MEPGLQHPSGGQVCRDIVTPVFSWLLCCVGGTVSGVLGCAGALAWPLSPQNMSGSALHGLELGALFGVLVGAGSVFFGTSVKLRLILIGTACVCLVVALMTYVDVAASAAV